MTWEKGAKKTLIGYGLAAGALLFGGNYIMNAQEERGLRKDSGLVRVVKSEPVVPNKEVAAYITDFEKVEAERFAKAMNERPVEINYDAIEQIESSGNPRAYNRNSWAIGLRQITPIVLKEWNQLHPNEQYNSEDLFNPEINRKIGNWYLEERIPYYLKYYGLEDNIENRLASYNWGIGNVKKIGGVREKNMDKLPKETRNYIKKYRQLTSEK